jgi:hypothetical protein
MYYNSNNSNNNNNNNNNDNNNIYIYPTGVVVSNKNPDGENPSVFWERWIFGPPVKRRFNPWTPFPKSWKTQREGGPKKGLVQ